MAAMGDENGQPRIGVFRLVFGALWLAIVVVVPAVGVWTASSLAAYRNGPVWLVSIAGLLLFPILPLLWEARSAVKHARQRTIVPRALTFTDRLVFRTLFLNLVFLAALLLSYPTETFAALATRGDWFLDGRAGPRVEGLRSQLFQAASGLEWLYKRAHPNEYRGAVDPGPDGPPGPKPEPARVERTRVEPIPTPAPGETPPVLEPVQPPAMEVSGALSWPVPAELHPLVAAVPPLDETSYLSVARYIDANEKDPWQRVKALHDYVADRVAYDVDALQAGKRPPQDPETVFRRRLAVCAGYANLVAAMGNAIGEEIRVIPGDARLESSDLAGDGHAWNAAKVEGRWVLLDATWDAGSVTASGFRKRFDTRYLFVPPEVLGVTHFPEDPGWQLREPPLSRGDFFRQPVLRAGFFADGLTLVSPDRSQVTVEKDVALRLRNPRGRSLIAKLEAEEGGEKVPCRVGAGTDVTVDCALPRRGRYRVRIYSAGQPRLLHDLVGEIEVNGSGG